MSKAKPITEEAAAATDFAAELRDLRAKVSNYDRYVNNLARPIVPKRIISFQLAGAPAGIDPHVALNVATILAIEPNGDDPMTSVVIVSYPVHSTQSNCYIVKWSVASNEKRWRDAYGEQMESTQALPSPILSE